ncbi:hypothetical protein ACFTVM_35770, partial [Nocardia sp. NPDC057030]
PVPNPGTEATDDSSGSGINRWWGIPIGLAITAVVGGLLAMIGRRRSDPAHSARGPVTPATRTAPRGDATAASAAAQRGSATVAGAHEMHRDAPRTRG